jgi:ATP-dependent Clp protease protease subunit
MSLYDEKPPKPTKVKNVDIDDKSIYESVSEQMATLMDFDDSVIYLTEEITDTTLVDLMIRIRAILKNRDEDQSDEPINIIINSPGGNFFEMIGIIDYLESLSVKVNTICRGQAMSAAAIILACGTGTRMMSKRSVVMFHQSSSFLDGKTSDLSSYLEHLKRLETVVYNILADRTKKDSGWWKDQMKTDLFLTAEELLEYGVIDAII